MKCNKNIRNLVITLILIKLISIGTIKQILPSLTNNIIPNANDYQNMINYMQIMNQMNVRNNNNLNNNINPSQLVIYF